MRLGSPLVLNGVPAYVPYSVSLVDTYSNTHFCGGAILNSFVILTAAHCFLRKGGRKEGESALRQYWRYEDEIRVVAGQYSLQWRDPTEQIRYIKNYFAPAGFNTTTLEHDFGYIILKNPLRLNPKVKAISLPGFSRRFTGNVTVSGWGLTKTFPGDVEDRSDTLQQTELEIIPNEICQTFYPNKTDEVSSGMFCGISATSTICRGDSGSPVTCEEEIQFLDPPHVKRKTVLCGLVSWGGGECEVTSNGAIKAVIPPSVFTRLSVYTGWLYKYISPKFPNHFTCISDFQLIPVSEKCDFKQDCDDGSDEFDCGKGATTATTTTRTTTTSSGTCGNLRFKCLSGDCIPSLFLCDGDRDCDFGEDEVGCLSDNSTVTNTTVTTTIAGPALNASTTETLLFLCRDFNYVPMSKRCDNVTDCQDGSDEIGCDGNTTIPTNQNVDVDVTMCTNCFQGNTNYLQGRSHNFTTNVTMESTP